MSRIRLVSSASGMKCDGEMSPWPGSRQRSSASAPDHAAVAQIHLGLVQDHQLVALQSAAQLALQHQPLDRRRIHLRHVECAGVAAVLLRVIHRRIGVADQVDHVLRIVRADRDADAGGQIDLLLVHVEGAADLVEKRARERAQAGAVVGIAGSSSTNIANSSPARRPITVSLLKFRVSRSLRISSVRSPAAVAEGVVDLLEAVQIEVQQRERALVAARARDRLLQQMLKLHAVRHLA